MFALLIVSGKSPVTVTTSPITVVGDVGPCPHILTLSQSHALNRKGSPPTGKNLNLTFARQSSRSTTTRQPPRLRRPAPPPPRSLSHLLFYSDTLLHHTQWSSHGQPLASPQLSGQLCAWHLPFRHRHGKQSFVAAASASPCFFLFFSFFFLFCVIDRLVPFLSCLASGQQ